MSAWQPIDTAPQDGRKLWLKRVHKGRIVKEGWGLWGVRSPAAPLRQPIPAQLPGEETIWPDIAYCDRPTWLTEDRLYTFPTPTHWREGPPADAGALLSPGKEEPRHG